MFREQSHGVAQDVDRVEQLEHDGFCLVDKVEQQFLLNLLGTVITIIELKALELDDGVEKVHEACSEIP